MKLCPVCAKENMDDALHCVDCGVSLSGTVKSPWYFRAPILAAAFLAVGPLMLPMVWWHPVYKKRTKVVLTLVILAVTAVLVKMTVGALETLKDYYALAFPPVS